MNGHDAERIPPYVLDEQWFGFVHKLIEQMQIAFRNAQAGDQLNQKKMGIRLGKKPSFVSRCLSGQKNMTIRTIHDLARAMNCRLEVTLRPLVSLKPVNKRPPAYGSPPAGGGYVSERDEPKTGAAPNIQFEYAE
jgi:hypothetical protein